MAARAMFHPKTGNLVKLTNQRRTAQRKLAHQEFNNAIVFSAIPLRDNQLFEVRIDKMVCSWSGSIEMGVTAVDPGSCTTFPGNAPKLQESWILSGSGLLHNGQHIMEDYGLDLDRLVRGDRVGVMRSKNGDLRFFVNGKSKGVVANGVPPRVFVAINLYGKCAQITAVDAAKTLSGVSNYEEVAVVPLQPLRFASRCGRLAVISEDGLTAERSSAACEFNNGVAVTYRPLRDDELFEVCLERMLRKWSGSIEIGVTIHDPTTFEFPATMTSILSGTVILSSLGIVINGVRQWRNYGSFNYNALQVGDRLGVMRRSSGNVHFFVNGVDQGIAATDIPQCVYGVVDVYGNTQRVSIVTPPHVNGCQGGSSDSFQSGGNNNCYCSSNVVQGGVSPRTTSNIIPATHHPLMTSSVNDDVERRREEEQEREDGEQETKDDAERVECCVSSKTDKETCNGKTAREGMTFVPYDKSVSSNLIYISEDDKIVSFVMSTLKESSPFETLVLTSRPLRVGEAFEIVVKFAQPGSLFLVGVVPHLSVENKSGGVGGAQQTAAATVSPLQGIWLLVGKGIIPEEEKTSFLSIAEEGDDAPSEEDSAARVQTDDRICVLLCGEGKIRFSHTTRHSDVPTIYTAETKSYPLRAALRFCGQPMSVALAETAGEEENDDEREGDECCEASINACSTTTTITESIPVAAVPLTFHRRHGHRIALSADLHSASRTNPQKQFDYAVVFSSRPLRDNELFEVRIDKMVKRWCGSLELGVTRLSPIDLGVFPSTMTHVTDGTWILSGNTLMKDGKHMSESECNLDQLGVGDRVGVMRRSDATLHFYINGVDQGAAFTEVTGDVWVVADVYAQCTQISIVAPSSSSASRPPVATTSGSATVSGLTSAVPTSAADHRQSAAFSAQSVEHVQHQLSWHAGVNVDLRNEKNMAHRLRHFDHGLVFSASPLECGELFEVQLEQVNTRQWAGVMTIGLTDCPPTAAKSYSSAHQLLASPSHCTFLVVGNQVVVSPNRLVRQSYGGPLLQHLYAGLRVGIQHCSDGSIRVHVNGEDAGPALYWRGAGSLLSVASLRCLPYFQQPALYAFVDVHGPVETVSLCSRSVIPSRLSSVFSVNDANNHLLALGKEGCYSAHEWNADFYGRNIQFLGGQKRCAIRVHGYSHGIVVTQQPLARGQLFRVCLDRLRGSWRGSISIGVTTYEGCTLAPSCESALDLKRHAWVIAGDQVFHNGNKIGSVSVNLNTLRERRTLGIVVDYRGNFRLFVDQREVGVVTSCLPCATPLYGIVDLYGRCEQATIINDSPTAKKDAEDGCVEYDVTGETTTTNTTTTTSGSAVAVEREDVSRNGAGMYNSNSVDALNAPSTLQQPCCEYWSSCLRFIIDVIRLPKSYFAAKTLDTPVCYCALCTQLNSKEKSSSSALSGWCAFNLRVRDNDSAAAMLMTSSKVGGATCTVRAQTTTSHGKSASGGGGNKQSPKSASRGGHVTAPTNSWIDAYVPVSSKTLRKCLDSNQIISEEDWWCWSKEEGDIGVKMNIQIYSSPKSFDPFSYTDSVTKKRMSAGICLKVLVRCSSGNTEDFPSVVSPTDLQFQAVLISFQKTSSLGVDVFR